jgi:hypothetical protein
MSPAYSISIRLQRVTTESAHVSVPITAELLQCGPGEPAQQKLDVERIKAMAVQLGKLPETVWRPDGEPVVLPHPWQTPPDSN